MTHRPARAARPRPAVDALEGRTLLAADPIAFAGKLTASYVDADGGTVVVALKGPGSGVIEFTGNSPADAAAVVLNGTTAASSLSIKGDTRFGQLQVNGGLKSLTGKTLDLAGDLTVSGGLPKIQVRSVFNSTMTIGATAPVSLALGGDATEVSLIVAGDVKSIKLGSWIDNDGTPDGIAATNVNSLTAQGNFGAGIAAGTIAKVNVGGTIVGSAIRATVNLGSLSAGGLRNSFVFAGMRADLSDLPTSTADFSNGIAAIRSITLKGKLPGTFANTHIAAPSIGKLSLGPIATYNALHPFGVAGDRVDAFSAASNQRGAFKLARQEPPTVAVSEDDFVVRVL
jgi:hypothetical protein